MTRLAPEGSVIAVWSTLRDDGRPVHGYNAEVLHFYLVLCVALVLAFPEPRGWRRWRLLAITIGLLVAFHALALLVTVEHTYAVRMEDVSTRNYTSTERAVYEWLYQSFDYFAVQVVPAVTLVLLFLRYGGLFHKREQDSGAALLTAREPLPQHGPRGGRRRAVAAGIAVLTLAVALAGWHHLGKVRARQSEALCARGYRTLAAGAVDQAAAMFRESAALKPRFLEAHDGLGHALLSAREPGPAEAAFREALRLDPTYLPSMIGLANALLMAGRVDDAVQALTRARDAHSDRWEPQYNLAQALIQAGRTSDAEGELLRTVAMNPELPAARFELARLLIRTGRRCEALPHLEAYIEQEPGSPHAELVRQTIDAARAGCSGAGEAAGPRP